MPGRCKPSVWCLGNEATRCEVRVRFLRMVTRSIGKPQTPSSELSSVIDAENIEMVERLEVNGKTFSSRGKRPWKKQSK